jgi:Na+(H+)/acetate symporter ActP
MGPVGRLAKARVTTDFFDARLGQMLCFVAAIALFVLAVLKLCRLGLTEGQLIIGLLAAIACSLLLVVLGLLLPISAALRKDRQE